MARVLDKLGRQLRRREADGDFRCVGPEAFIVDLLSLCIFPVAARPMIQEMLSLDEDDFRALIRRRRETLPTTFIQGLRP